MLESPNRQMPHSTDAEQAILGAMLLDEKVCEDVKLKLQPDDFYHHRHRIIYENDADPIGPKYWGRCDNSYSVSSRP